MINNDMMETIINHHLITIENRSALDFVIVPQKLLPCLHLAHFAILNFTHECHRFFTELSVLPGRRREISAHRFPNFSCMIEIIWSSSFVQLRLSTCGDSWLCHLSLHCFAFLDFSIRATLLQLLAPCALTYLCSFASSSLVPAIGR